MTATECGCPSYRLSRRGFLKGLGVAGAATAASPLLSVQASYAEGYAGDVLVVLSLRGGMDGLSLVAPVGDPDYARLRPTLAVPASTGVPTGDRMFALNPGLAPLKPLWDSGLVGAVHAVDTLDESRSHFSAMEELERAAPGTSLRSGWLDRVLGTRATGTAFQAVQLGKGTAGTMFAGPSSELAATSLEGFTLAGGAIAGARMTRAMGLLQDGVASPAVQPARTTLGVLAAVDAVVDADPTPRNGAVYPDSDIGRGLADVARLVRAGRGLQAVAVDEGDWDMHTDIGTSGTGRFASRANDLARALVALSQDLGPLMSGVTVLTISEFGRRAAENGSGGADHGHGNAMLLMGGGIVGGKVHGRWPGLTAAALDHGDLAGTTDYRQVIGELLVRRTGLSATGLGQVFPGLTPAFLGLARAA